ncbi:hypothetical protein BH24ACT3_BH24ACT3_14160 [soil metagenome]
MAVPEPESPVEEPRRTVVPGWSIGPDRPAVVLALRLAIGVLLLGAAVAVFLVGANRPADPFFAEPGVESPSGGGDLRGEAPGGEAIGDPNALGERFVARQVQIFTADGDLREWCLLLAATAAEQQRGLMEVTDPDLDGYDGMLFDFGTDRTGGFFMRNTPMPLSIAFIASDGGLVGAFDMEPCEDVEDCPTYRPDDDYRYAVEVSQGGLDDLGLMGGSTLQPGGTCSP